MLYRWQVGLVFFLSVSSRNIAENGKKRMKLICLDSAEKKEGGKEGRKGERGSGWEEG